MRDHSGPRFGPGVYVAGRQRYDGSFEFNVIVEPEAGELSLEQICEFTADLLAAADWIERLVARGDDHIFGLEVE